MVPTATEMGLLLRSSKPSKWDPEGRCRLVPASENALRLTAKTSGDDQGGFRKITKNKF